MWNQVFKSASDAVLFVAAVIFLAALTLSSARAQGEQAGVSAGVHGAVQIAALADPVGRQLKSGEAIFLKDRITSGENSGLQILLMDETVFTIGPQSAIEIDEFVYDPDTGIGKVSAQVVKGTFRFITGKVAHKKPSAMNVRLPHGTIGVRGTIVAGSVDENGRALIVLLGPGLENDANARTGSIAVENAGSQILITRPGWGTVIENAQALPSAPAQVPSAQIDALTHSLKAAKTPADPDNKNKDQAEGGKNGEPTQRAENPTSSDAQSSKRRSPMAKNAGAAGKLAGADISRAITASADTDSFNKAMNTFSQTSSAAAEDAKQQLVYSDGITLKEQLLHIQTGIFHYAGTGAFTQTSSGPVTGTMSVKMDIDFGSRIIGGGNSSITVDTLSFGGNIDPAAATTGITAFSYDDSQTFGLAQGSFDGHLTNSDFSGTDGHLSNTDGIIANTLTINVQYDDGTNSGSGTATSAARESGAS